MKEIILSHNGFHGRTDLRYRPHLGTVKVALIGSTVEECAVISPRVARRLNRAVCGVAGCKCGERVAIDLSYYMGWVDTCWVVPIASGDVRGNYPQQSPLPPTVREGNSPPTLQKGYPATVPGGVGGDTL